VCPLAGFDSSNPQHHRWRDSRSTRQVAAGSCEAQIPVCCSLRASAEARAVASSSARTSSGTK
jgi:hypothetical protein